MRFALVPLAALLLPAALSAQVGYDPARSPYRELRFGQFVGVSGGWFSGDGGSLGLSPHGGRTLGFRYDFLGANTLSLGLAGTQLDLERIAIDPDESEATRVTGPFGQTGLLFEGIIQFNLTGGKTWNGLAPFASGGIGLLLASKVEEDASDYDFRTRGVITPGFGTRFFLTQRLFLRAEARATFWQVTYPLSFVETPANAPNDPPVLVGRSRKEWVVTPWYSVGLSYAFHRPF